MDQNEKVANDKISKLENEIKVLKNEVQAVLLDLRESYLNMGNPFNQIGGPAAIQPIVITQQSQAREPRPEPQIKEISQQENVRNVKSTTNDNPDSEAPQPENQSQSGNGPIRDHNFEFTAEEVEVRPVLRPNSKVKIAEPEPADRKNMRLDLVTMAGLTGWVEQSTKKIGQERTEAVLEISETMGYVYADLKPILIKLIKLAPQKDAEHPIKTRDYMDSLIKLNGLLGKDNHEESTLLLLSLISGDNHHG